MHEDHILFLKRCKAKCSKLVVGLTTDERMVVEKRKPVMSYKHRKCVLEALEYVDVVVDNTGQSKYLDWCKIHFDVVFAESSRKGTPEYTDFAKFETGARIIFFDRGQSTSTTGILTSIEDRFIHGVGVGIGITGMITRLPFSGRLLKTLNFATGEHIGDTVDVLGVHDRFGYLRNWKHKTGGPVLPNVAGVHPGREIMVNEMTKEKPWSVYVGHVVLYSSEDDDRKCEDEKEPEDMVEHAMWVAKQRQYPKRVVGLLMRDGGITLAEYRKKYTKGEWQRAVDRVTKIIEELGKEGIVHGDIHPKNVLVAEHTGEVSIIDWGWATHCDMTMSPEERTAHERALADSFDTRHFIGSLK